MATFSSSLVILDSVDSTNNYAMACIRDGTAGHGKAWFSYEQTRGKGRRGKIWETQKGKNIILSIILETESLSNLQFSLNMAVAVACYDLFTTHAGENTSIKWPNDIFWNDRKAGGVLIENIIGHAWQWSVVGIGMNINQTEFNIKDSFLPVSLKQITGKEFNIIELATQLYEGVLKRYNELKNAGPGKIFAEYNEHLFRLNKKTKLKKSNAVFETTVTGVNQQGQLLTSDSMQRQFNFDEIEWVK